MLKAPRKIQITNQAGGEREEEGKREEEEGEEWGEGRTDGFSSTVTLRKAASHAFKGLQENDLEPRIRDQMNPVETFSLVPSGLRQEGVQVSTWGLCWENEIPPRAALTENKRAPSSSTPAVTTKDKCSLQKSIESASVSWLEGHINQGRDLP